MCVQSLARAPEVLVYMYERPNCCHCKTLYVKLNDHETFLRDVHVIFTVKEVSIKDATVGALPFFPVSIYFQRWTIMFPLGRLLPQLHNLSNRECR